MRFPVNIHLLSWLPNPEDQFHQSSLPSLMGSVLTGREIDDVDTVLHRIGTRAEHKCRKTFRAEAENQGKWRRPEMLVKENWGQWEGGFGGGWHPLSLVVCGKTLEAMGGPEGGKLLGGRDQGGIYGLLGLGKVSQPHPISIYQTLSWILRRWTDGRVGLMNSDRHRTPNTSWALPNNAATPATSTSPCAVPTPNSKTSPPAKSLAAPAGSSPGALPHTRRESRSSNRFGII